MSMSQYMDTKEFADAQMKDQLGMIKYTVDRLIEKLEGLTPDEYNYAVIDDFMSSITSDSIRARRLADRLKQEVKNGKDT